MSVYRELASELRANKAIIDSLNSRNQQLLRQNQFLKQEIHNVVQSALSLGQAAGVARPANHLVRPDAISSGSIGSDSIGSDSISSARETALSYSASSEFPTLAEPHMPPYIPERIAPETLARLAHMETSAASNERAYEQPIDRSARPDALPNRVPSPIVPVTQKNAQKNAQKNVQRNAASVDESKGATKKIAKPRADKSAARAKAVSARAQAAKSQTPPAVGRRTEDLAIKQSNPPKPKLFTEQSGSFRSTALEAQESKEISGIWLVLSIILIVVTAFGAGFLIMKPLLNER